MDFETWFNKQYPPNESRLIYMKFRETIRESLEQAFEAGRVFQKVTEMGDE